jgi:hypothetical protein
MIGKMVDFESYQPRAIYYEQADSLEYVRRDGPAVYRRVDKQLTLILDMDSRYPVGFKLKGFKHFFISSLKPRFELNDGDFLPIVEALQSAMTAGGDELFDVAERQSAYRQALEIASEDNVQLDDFPRSAGALR